MKTFSSFLFVCLGNICRSPAGEGILRRKAAERGLSLRIDSAGIGGWHAGQLPDARMRRQGALRGYDFNSRARQICRGDFDRFDLILVMDADNFEAVSRLARSDADRRKVRRVTDFCRRFLGTAAVPDPYYGGTADFDHALDLLEDACEGLLDALAGD